MGPDTVAADDHALVSALAVERFGVVSARRPAKLRARLRAHALRDLRQYCQLLRRSNDADEEWGLFADAVTNSETFLFRGANQLDALVTLLPSLAVRGRPLRVLSAGCATGEEAYSAAAVLAAHARHLRGGFEVVGLDISTPRLAVASAGRYASDQIRLGHSAAGVMLDAHFERDGTSWRPRPALRRHVSFRVGNLAGDADLGRFDVVFCRNVLIYAHDDAWPRFLRTLERALVPGGYLFLGDSESLHGRTTRLALRRLATHFAYQLPCPSAS